MIIIGYASANNGMTTWCLEAANALAEAEIPYYLICNDDVPLTGNEYLNVIILKDHFAYPKKLIEKIKLQTWHRLFRRDTSISIRILACLQKRGIFPTAMLWNNPVYLNVQLNIPQYVVAWSYPTSLKGYLKKVSIIADRQSATKKIFACLDAVGYYMSDWYGYKNAAGVIAIHNTLHQELIKNNINAHLIYPSIGVRSIVTKPDTDVKAKILMVALNLEEPRKGIKWLLRCLQQVAKTKFEIHLIGNCSDDFKTLFKELPIVYHGLLKRSEVNQMMTNMNIFLFGSTLDDWGFVQTEAMSNGMIVLSPDIAPFAEIVPDERFLYQARSESSLLKTLDWILNSDLEDLKICTIKHVKEKFARSKLANWVREIELISPKESDFPNSI